MARPREFDEAAVLDAAMECFWAKGYEATSVRDLTARTGLCGASLYNAFGDKRLLYARALDRYVEDSIGARIRRCERLAPLAAIETFFAEILERSLRDPARRGCMLVNAALEAAPPDAALRATVAGTLVRIEDFFAGCVRAGQADGTVAASAPPEDVGRHLLAVLMGTRVLARIRPEPALLEGAVATALSVLRSGAAGGGEARCPPDV